MPIFDSCIQMSNGDQDSSQVLYLTYLALSSLQLKYDVHVMRGGLRFCHSTDIGSMLVFKAVRSRYKLSCHSIIFQKIWLSLIYIYIYLSLYSCHVQYIYIYTYIILYCVFNVYHIVEMIYHINFMKIHRSFAIKLRSLSSPYKKPLGSDSLPFRMSLARHFVRSIAPFLSSTSCGSSPIGLSLRPPWTCRLNELSARANMAG